MKGWRDMWNCWVVWNILCFFHNIWHECPMRILSPATCGAPQHIQIRWGLGTSSRSSTGRGHTLHQVVCENLPPQEWDGVQQKLSKTAESVFVLGWWSSVFTKWSVQCFIRPKMPVQSPSAQVTLGRFLGNLTHVELSRWPAALPHFSMFTLLVGGLEHFLLFHVLRIIIPIDEYFSKGLKPPTRLFGVAMPFLYLVGGANPLLFWSKRPQGLKPPSRSSGWQRLVTVSNG